MTQSERLERTVRRIAAATLIAFPALFIIVFLLHFGRENFFEFHLRYVPPPAADIVPRIITGVHAGGRIHDPHLLAYLGLPVLLVAAYALYLAAKPTRRALGLLALLVTCTGVVYLGGLFGLWTTLYGAIGNVDPRYTGGATATFAALTAPHGPFLLTKTLAKLSMLGFALQALVLWGIPRIPRWSPILIVIGCATVVGFWDLDNWMLLGTLLILAGFIPIRSALLAGR
jgi:hypothetical protein